MNFADARFYSSFRYLKHNSNITMHAICVFVMEHYRNNSDIWFKYILKSKEIALIDLNQFWKIDLLKQKMIAWLSNKSCELVHKFSSKFDVLDLKLFPNWLIPRLWVACSNEGDTTLLEVEQEVVMPLHNSTFFTLVSMDDSWHACCVNFIGVGIW